MRSRPTGFQTATPSLLTSNVFQSLRALWICSRELVHRHRAHLVLGALWRRPCHLDRGGGGVDAREFDSRDVWLLGSWLAQTPTVSTSTSKPPPGVFLSG